MTKLTGPGDKPQKGEQGPEREERREPIPGETDKPMGGEEEVGGAEQEETGDKEDKGL